MTRRFGALILSHGRPERVSVTINSLRRCGYTGPYWIVLDDEDETLPEYQSRWGPDRIVTFTKRDDALDMGDNGGPRATPVYARHAADQIAAQLNLTHYVQLDDDYVVFEHRYAENGKLAVKITRRLDDVIEAHLDFLDSTPIRAVAFAQGGDMLGGAEPRGFYHQGLHRKVMNSFFLRTGEPLEWTGRLNDDVCTYVTTAARGDLTFTYTRFMLDQFQTQSQAGGITTAYLEAGTYVKSFYTVMMAPSCTTVVPMGSKHRRLHHRISWPHLAPKILHQRHRKPR